MNEFGTVTPDFSSKFIDSFKRRYEDKRDTPEYKESRKKYNDSRRVVPLVVRENWGKCL